MYIKNGNKNDNDVIRKGTKKKLLHSNNSNCDKWNTNRNVLMENLSVEAHNNRRREKEFGMLILVILDEDEAIISFCCLTRLCKLHTILLYMRIIYVYHNLDLKMYTGMMNTY